MALSKAGSFSREVLVSRDVHPRQRWKSVFFCKVHLFTHSFFQRRGAAIVETVAEMSAEERAVDTSDVCAVVVDDYPEELNPFDGEEDTIIDTPTTQKAKDSTV